MTETAAASARFLQAFADLEDFLLEEPEVDRTRGFASAVRFLSRRHSGVKAMADDLLQMAQLRNAIVHERRDNQPIAEPHETVVAEIEHMRDALLAPIRLTDLRPGKVEVCAPTESIAIAGGRMADGGFSQLPVYDDDGFSALLTTRVIARWVAHEHAAGRSPAADTPVREVLTQAQGGGGHGFLPRSATSFDAIEAFRAAVAAGEPLAAILVTEHGKGSEKPLAIVTPADMPLLIGAG